MNYVPGLLKRKLASPFELVHGSKPDPRACFQLSSVGFFPVDKEGNVTRSQHQPKTLSGISVTRDSTSNTIVFYNSATRQYYRPYVYSMDKSRIPHSIFPHRRRRLGGGRCCGGQRW